MQPGRQESPTAQAVPPGPEVAPCKYAAPPGLGLGVCDHVVPSQRKINVRSVSVAVKQRDMHDAPTAQAMPWRPRVRSCKKVLAAERGIAIRAHLPLSQRKMSAGCAAKSAHPDKQDPPTAHAVEADRAETAYNPPGNDACGAGQARLDAGGRGVTGRAELSVLRLTGTPQAHTHKAATSVSHRMAALLGQWLMSAS